MSIFTDNLSQELETLPVYNNKFFTTFKTEYLTEVQMKKFAGQYFWFCQNFITALIGLIYNTPPTEAVRMELLKTLWSEMGYGKDEAIHLNLLRQFTTRLGLSEHDLQQVTPIPEIKNYIDYLGTIFLTGDYREAIGAEFGVETTAADEFTYLYPGIKKYENFSAADIHFFAFHLIEEQQHGSWLAEAVEKIARTPEDEVFIRKGALEAGKLWGEFWEGMYRYVVEENK